MLDSNVPIINVEIIADRLKQNEDIDVSDVKIRQYMKDELSMRYRISRKVNPQANS